MEGFYIIMALCACGVILAIVFAVFADKAREVERNANIVAEPFTTAREIDKQKGIPAEPDINSLSGEDLTDKLVKDNIISKIETPLSVATEARERADKMLEKLNSASAKALSIRQRKKVKDELTMSTKRRNKTLRGSDNFVSPRDMSSSLDSISSSVSVNSSSSSSSSSSFDSCSSSSSSFSSSDSGGSCSF